jgi:hypothetical protein
MLYEPFTRSGRISSQTRPGRGSTMVAGSGGAAAACVRQRFRAARKPNACSILTHFPKNITGCALEGHTPFCFNGGGGGNRTRVRKPSAIGSTCLSRSIDLTDCYPTGREDNQRFRLGFNDSAPNVRCRDLVRVDAWMPRRAWTHKHGSSQTAPYWGLSSECVVVVVGNYSFAVGLTRSSAPRHAPQVSQPTSNPGRPLKAVSRIP